MGVGTALNAQLTGIAQSNSEIRVVESQYTRTLSVGGKPYIDVGYNLAVGAVLKEGVSWAEWGQSGKEDPAMIEKYVGSLNAGFPGEKSGHIYTFSIDLENGTIYDFRMVY